MAARAKGEEWSDDAVEAVCDCGGDNMVAELGVVVAASWTWVVPPLLEDKRERRRAMLVTLSTISVLINDASVSVT